MDKGDKLEKKIEESFANIRNNLDKVKELENVLEKLESKEEEA